MASVEIRVVRKADRELRIIIFAVTTMRISRINVRDQKVEGFFLLK